MRSLVVAMMIAGCGGSGVDAKDYISASVNATCDYETRCGLFPDTASCLEFFNPNYNDVMFFAELDMGLVHYDPAKAEECINDVRNAPCDTTSMDSRVRPAACNSLITGATATGDTCVSNEQCQSTACSKPNGAVACGSGTCVATTALGKLGEPCATRACDSGLVCDNTKTCAMLYTEGMACAGNDQCNYGLACDAIPTGFCRQAPKIGDACPDHLCAEIGAYCATDGRCTALGLSGAACTSTQQCSPYYPCNMTTGTCQAYPITGQPCAAGCSDGSYCDTSTMICTARLADGAACTQGYSCQSETCDTTTTHTCIEPVSCF
jgi:hypothetical protein